MKIILNNLKAKLLKWLGDSLTAYGEFEFLTYDAVTGELKKREVMYNKIVGGGIALFPKLITGNVANVTDGLINYCAIGTGDTAPTSGDTQLETEGFRKTVTSANFTTDTASYSTYFTHAEGNMVIEEVGMFINGSATADSGTLFSRISTENSQLPYTKDNTETLTINYRVVFSEVNP